MSNSKIIIRNIYLYLATFVGLMMVVITTGILLRLVLQTWVFPLAAEEMYNYDKVPTTPYIKCIDENTNLETIQLTPEEKESLATWQTDYKTWKEKNDKIDWKKANLQKQAVDNFSIMFVGLILFLSHGYVLRKDKKKE